VEEDIIYAVMMYMQSCIGLYIPTTRTTTMMYDSYMTNRLFQTEFTGQYTILPQYYTCTYCLPEFYPESGTRYNFLKDNVMAKAKQLAKKVIWSTYPLFNAWEHLEVLPYGELTVILELAISHRYPQGCVLDQALYSCIISMGVISVF